jgi:hypothetical protein
VKNGGEKGRTKVLDDISLAELKRFLTTELITRNAANIFLQKEFNATRNRRHSEPAEKLMGRSTMNSYIKKYKPSLILKSTSCRNPSVVEVGAGDCADGDGAIVILLSHITHAQFDCQIRSTFPTPHVCSFFSPIFSLLILLLHSIRFFFPHAVLFVHLGVINSALDSHSLVHLS